MPDASGLCELTAVDMIRHLRAGEVSATELVGAHLRRIEELNPEINAVVTVTADLALERAARADRVTAAGGPIGALHGLPVGHKDLQDTRGIRTTYGSRLYADHVPDTDSLVVERMTEAGAIVLGKTNTPEFGTGSQTYNAVFGETRNPYDLTRTAGGSSGGAAAALATGMVALADGSDMAGSLRNPASFCNVVGLRPSIGRVPSWPTPSAWFSLSVDGPMARTVTDLALFLSVLAGYDARSPLALPGDGGEFTGSLERDLRGCRVAWSQDLGGLPVDPEVTAVLEREGREAFASLGCVVRDVEPDLTGAEQSFRTWRAWYYDLEFGADLDRNRELLNSSVVENIEWGRRLSGADLARAEVARTELWHRMRRMMADYDVLVAPVVQVPPFAVTSTWVHSIAGQPQSTYLDWMRSAYWISATGLPAMSVPCGFTPDGLPVGIQLIGRPQSELALLQIAYGVEQATGAGTRRPPVLAQADRERPPPAGVSSQT